MSAKMPSPSPGGSLKRGDVKRRGSYDLGGTGSGKGEGGVGRSPVPSMSPRGGLRGSVRINPLQQQPTAPGMSQLAQRSVPLIVDGDADIAEEMDKVATGWGYVFPTFSRESTRAYRQFNRSTIALQFYLPILLVTAVHFVTRYDLQALGGHTAASGILQAAFAVAIVAYVLFHVALAPHVMVQFPRWKDVMDRWATWIDALPVLIEEVVLITALLSIGLVFLYRVFVGACPAGTSIWDTQNCNPFADLKGLPPEMAIFLYAIILGVQVVLKNVSLPGLCLAWVLATFFLAFATIFTGAWADLWNLIEVLYMSNISFEIERQQRVSYARQVLAQKHKRDSLERLKSNDVVRRALDQFELELNKERSAKEIAAQKADAERELRNTEAQQLRSLMGNVAHDLKTPLFSFEADVDTLKVFFDALPRDAVDATVAALNAGGADETHPSELFESLWATMRFMVAAINRGQDYTKASNGVALVPANGSFMITSTVAMVSRCVKHLFPAGEGRRLVIHPLPADMSDWIISDAHWILENMLCYISNGVKYSDGGDLDMYIELVPTTEAGEDALLLTPVDSVAAMTAYTDGVARSAGRVAGAAAAAPAAPVAAKPPVNGASHRVRVTIEDCGVGIAASQRAGLFQPFRQAQRLTGGTGLGLFSLLKRVEALGGACGVTDRRDGRSGSSFWFSFPYRPDDTVTAAALKTPMHSTKTPAQSPRIEVNGGRGSSAVQPRQQNVEGTAIDTLHPLRRPKEEQVAEEKAGTGQQVAVSAVDAAAAIASAIPTRTGTPTAPTVPPLRILLTDDTPSILKVVGRLLRSNGHTVETAVNGSKSLEMLKAAYEKGECDLLLTDLQMPVMDGIECTKRFRAWEAEQLQRCVEEGRPRRSRFVIVGMSANSDAQSRSDALDAGMDYFVGKPFRYDDFSGFILRHWAVSEAAVMTRTGRDSFVAIRRPTKVSVCQK